MYIHTYIHIHIHTWLHTHVHTYVCTYIHIRVYAYNHTCDYKYCYVNLTFKIKVCKEPFPIHDFDWPIAVRVFQMDTIQN